ncbi:MAG: pentapeptide repeat-containing protein [Myxococcota bacterium]
MWGFDSPLSHFDPDGLRRGFRVLVPVLFGAVFSGCNLEGAVFVETDLSGARFDESTTCPDGQPARDGTCTRKP